VGQRATGCSFSSGNGCRTTKVAIVRNSNCFSGIYKTHTLLFFPNSLFFGTKRATFAVAFNRRFAVGNSIYQQLKKTYASEYA